MLSRKIKKKISKTKRTTKRYLTKVGIRQSRKNPDPSLMPFLWTNPFGSKIHGLKEGKYYVIIAGWEYKPLFDPFLTRTEKSKSQYVLIPDITIIKHKYEFDIEQDALDFIAKWWNHK